VTAPDLIQRWVGSLAPDWRWGRLGSLASVKARLGWRGLKADEYVEKGFILLATPNIKEREIDFTDVNFINAHRYQESPEIMLQVGDVLVVKDGATLGISNVIRSLPAPATVNGSIAVVRPLGELDSLYLMYFFQSQPMQALIQSVKAGMGVPHLFQADMRKFSVPVPPPQQQRRIATFLDSKTVAIDQLIQQKERLILLLQEKREALMTHAVTKGLDPGVPMKESGVDFVGTIPSHWRTLRIALASEKLCNGFVGPTRDILVDDGIPYLQSLHIKNGDVRFERPYFVESQWLAEHPRVRLRRGDVVIVQTGDIGQIAVIPDEWDGAGCHALIIFRPRVTVGLGSYFAWFLRSKPGRELLLREQTGALHPHLEVGKVREIPLPVPPVTEQREISERLALVDGELERQSGGVRQQLELLREYRQALISAAVTGQTRISAGGPNHG